MNQILALAARAQRAAIREGEKAQVKQYSVQQGAAAATHEVSAEVEAIKFRRRVAENFPALVADISSAIAEGKTETPVKIFAGSPQPKITGPGLEELKRLLEGAFGPGSPFQVRAWIYNCRADTARLFPEHDIYDPEQAVAICW